MLIFELKKCIDVINRMEYSKNVMKNRLILVISSGRHRKCNPNNLNSIRQIYSKLFCDFCKAFL